MRNEFVSVFDDCNGSVIARVPYNEILAPFLGLTVIENDDGQKSYILIKEAEIEGGEDYGIIITPEIAFKLIMEHKPQVLTDIPELKRFEETLNEEAFTIKYKD